MSSSRPAEIRGPAQRPAGDAGRVFARLERLSSGLGSGLAALTLSAAAVIGLAQVVSRFALEQPMPWSEPVVRSLLIWMAYLGVCGAIRTGSLVAVDVVYAVVPAPVQAAMRLVILVASLCFFAILGWFGLQMTEFVSGQILAGTGFSIAFAYAAIPVGAVLSMISLVAHYAATGAAPDEALDALKEQV